MEQLGVYLLEPCNASSEIRVGKTVSVAPPFA